MDVKNEIKRHRSFWQILKDLFTIHPFDEKDLKAWKKKNYETRRNLGAITPEEREEYEREYERKNKRY